MRLTARSFLDRGYIPLACNRYAGVAWQGEYLKDFWMWNSQLTHYEGGVRLIQTVKVSELKEAALRYWRDGWVPLKPVDSAFLRRMEGALRAHRGLKKEGIDFPDTPFLKMPEPIPVEFFGAEVRAYLGLKADDNVELKPQNAISTDALESYRKTRGG